MKICRFRYNEQVRYGIVEKDCIISFDDLEKLKNSNGDYSKNECLEKAEVELLPPTEPSKIVCVGRNYAEHAAEMGNEVPSEPMLFLKAPSSIITDGGEIIIPAQSNQVEHEGELAVVIGRQCKNLTAQDNPFEYILGYACFNDVTARDLQRKDVQFTRAKSFDTFCPIGAFVETELDVSDLRISTKVNGIIKQDGRTSQMIFSVPFLIKYISDQMTLLAGDVIATGTPAGVSKLAGGDICTVEIEGIGILQNVVRK